MITKGIKALTEEARSRIENLSPAEAMARTAQDDYLLVDLRDVRELQRDGVIAGAYHAPRGMLEFWIDPQSPYHKPALLAQKGLVFYCASGMRSALATDAVRNMGHRDVSHVTGGFAALKEAGAEIVTYKKPE
ncbi:rhodanese-like domain-containing protein [Epibacterium sp. SM1979]|uniref:Rhodanese-like domain-containing protein n=1 Tax=Tritonibacter litoralis TaxID=2662264 RepID=A0A843YFN2_9RHOB|nr:rhodanese-like domain-containing protein [Tritonibacter litoralis]MQQ09691.1 rhodanese-like domain-containing protein [Tritonibacter litoralis]